MKKLERLSTLQWDSMTTVDEMENEEEIKMEIREEYNKRLTEEIEKMRLLYNSYEGEMRVSIKGIFDAKINELNSLRHEWSSKEKAEVDDIIARLEHGKKTVIELEKKKMELSQEERNLTDSLEEEELYFKSLLAAKQREVGELQRQYSTLQVEYSRSPRGVTRRWRGMLLYSAVNTPSGSPGMLSSSMMWSTSPRRTAAAAAAAAAVMMREGSGRRPMDVDTKPLQVTPRSPINIHMPHPS